MNAADIKLRVRGTQWTSIQNSGTGRGTSRAVAEFLQQNSKFFERVCFGDFGYANATTYAIAHDRAEKFIAHAAKSGLVAAYDYSH